MLLSIIALISAYVSLVSAQAEFIIPWLTRNAVSAAASVRSDGVPEAQASSEANAMVSQVVNYPAFSSLINKAIQQFPQGYNSQVMISFADEGNKAFNQWTKGPEYKQFKSYYKAHITDFDTNKAEAVISSKFGNRTPPSADQIRSYVADPEAKRVGSSAYSEANALATDLGFVEMLSKNPHWKEYATLFK
ncbi:hypothetical protein TRVA0_023S01332 [Trichomonascus vanleenenianus]|uniref:uncharacterized protein n=1 Tax=Trichomonascus vanleenenianus TaxID=2268995 RepID=UPI003ECAF370